MTDKIILNNVTSFVNDTTAATAINSNNAVIVAAIDNTVSRDGTAPNQMQANFDMNSNRILNLPAPASSTEPIRQADLTTGTVQYTGGTNISVAGTTISTIASPTFTSVTSPTAIHSTSVTTPTIVNTGTLTLPTTTDTLVGRATTDTLTNKTLTAPVISTISNTGTLTLPTGTHTVVAKDTTDILTNKTIDTAGTGNHIQISGVDVTRGQILGEASSGNAAVGNIGEFVTANGSGVAMTSGTAFNTTSISLTAGDWDVWGFTGVSNTGATTYTFFSTGISVTNSVLGGQVMSMNLNIAGATYNFVAPMLRINIASTTTVFLVGTATFTGGSPTASGAIYARRAR